MTKAGPKELALKQQRIDDLSIPADLARPPETPEQAEKRRKKFAAKDTTGGLKVVTPHVPPPEKVRKAIARDLRGEAATELRGEATAELKTQIDVSIKPKTLPELAAAMSDPPRMKSPAKAETPAAKKQESAMKTSTKKTTAKVTKTAKPVAAPRGMAIDIGKLASRPNGASRAELIKLTGWKQQAWKWYFVNSNDNGFCQKFGYKLDVIEGKDGETRYRISKK